MTYYNRDNLFNYNPIQRGVQGNIGQQGTTGARGSEWELFSSENYLPIGITTDIGITTNFPLMNITYDGVGAVLGRDNKIYCTTWGSTFSLVIDVIGKTFESIFIQNNNYPGYLSGILGSNDKIYAAPWGGTGRIQVIDTIGKTADLLALPPFPVNWTKAGSEWYQRGCLATNDKIYFPPVGATAVLVVDSIGNTYYQIPISNPPFNVLTLTNKYGASIIGSDGKIYLFSGQTSWIAQIDPYTDLVNGQYFNAGENIDPRGGVLATDNNIYIINPATKIFKFNPIDKIISSKNVSNNGEFSNSLLAPSGLIYISFNPDSASNKMATYDYINDIYKVYTYPFKISSRSFCLHTNGSIYSVPKNVKYICEIKTGLPKYPPWMLDPYFNKY